MVEIKEIKSKLDELYGFDILLKRRIRRYAFAKKILTTLLLDYGYTNSEIVIGTGIAHDVILYNKKTISVVNRTDLEIYNRTIDELNLDGIKKINSIRSLHNNEFAEEIFEKLKCMSRKDIAYFKSQVFQPFLEKIDFEKSIINL